MKTALQRSMHYSDISYMQLENPSLAKTRILLCLPWLLAIISKTGAGGRYGLITWMKEDWRKNDACKSEQKSSVRIMYFSLTQFPRFPLSTWKVATWRTPNDSTLKFSYNFQTNLSNSAGCLASGSRPFRRFLVNSDLFRMTYLLYHRVMSDVAVKIKLYRHIDAWHRKM
jgi:hypothetical protein